MVSPIPQTENKGSSGQQNPGKNEFHGYVDRHAANSNKENKSGQSGEIGRKKGASHPHPGSGFHKHK